MTAVKPPRKLKKQAHKCFGYHSRTVTPDMVEDGTAKGKRAGDKQVHPKAYKDGLCDHRTRAEIRNAEFRRRPDDID